VAERELPPAPVVTVHGDPPPPPPRATPSYSRAVLPALAVAALAVVVAAAITQRPPPPPPVDARLVLSADAVEVSRTGVLVVPVVLHDRGPGHRVVSTRVYADPSREDPVVSPPSEVAPGEQRRFALLLAPDCSKLGYRLGIGFRASLLVQVANGDASQQLLLDVGSEPAVVTQVRALCELP